MGLDRLRIGTLLLLGFGTVALLVAVLVGVVWLGMGQAEDAVGAEPPAELEDAVRGLVQRAVPDLRAEVVERGMDRADIGLNLRDQLLDAAILGRIEQCAAGRATRRFDLADHPREALLV